MSGYPTALNNDGRILYVEEDLFGGPQYQSDLINDGGTFVRLPFPFNIGENSEVYVEASALNENGEAVGDYSFYGPYPFGAFYANMAWSLYGLTGARVAYFDGYRDYSSVLGLNDENVAVGQDGLSDVAALFTAASQPPGRVTDLKGLPGACPASGVAEAINDAGEIVGQTCNQAVRFSRTGYAQTLPIDSKGMYTYADADAINQAGDIVGNVGGAPRAFLYHLGKTVLLPLPADCSDAAEAYGVNASDEVVGDCGVDNLPVPFLYVHGRSYDLNTLIAPNSGWQLVDAIGINDRGEIIGTGYYNGTLYGVSLKPPA